MVAEQIDLRTRDSKHYLLDDGRTRSVLQEGIHYKRGDGSLHNPNRVFRQDVANEWVIDESDVRTHIYSTGSGGNLRWWFEMRGLVSNAGVRFQLPGAPTVSGSSVSYSDATGGTWTYTVTAKGSKLVGPPVTTRLGAKTFTFTFEYVGAPPAFATQADGSLYNGEIRIPRAKVLGADGQEYFAQGWTIPNSVSISFVWDDTSLPASAFPYRVDPSSTFTLGTNTDGQIARRTGPAYPPDSAVGWHTVVCYARKLWNGTNFVTDVGLLKWDTSTIPVEDTISSCDYRIFANSVIDSADNRNYNAESYQWDGVSATDHAENVGTGMFSVDITSITQGAYISIPVVDFTGIAKGAGAVTYMRTGISGGQPASTNTVRPWDVDDGATNSPPQLIVVHAPVTYEESMRPTGVWLSNLTGTHTDIADDPDAPDASWLVAP